MPWLVDWKGTEIDHNPCPKGYDKVIDNRDNEGGSKDSGDHPGWKIGGAKSIGTINVWHLFSEQSNSIVVKREVFNGKYFKWEQDGEHGLNNLTCGAELKISRSMSFSKSSSTTTVPCSAGTEVTIIPEVWKVNAGGSESQTSGSSSTSTVTISEPIPGSFNGDKAKTKTNIFWEKVKIDYWWWGAKDTVNALDSGDGYTRRYGIVVCAHCCHKKTGESKK